MKLTPNRLILNTAALAVVICLTQGPAPAQVKISREKLVESALRDRAPWARHRANLEAEARQRLATEVLRLTNIERQKARLAPLRLNSRLGSAAASHAGNMARQATMNHRLDGKGAGDRIQAAGYKYRAWAENIAQGYPSAAAVVAGWMKSPGHKANILNGTFTEIGIGVARKDARGEWYYCQVFGRPQ